MKVKILFFSFLLVGFLNSNAQNIQLPQPRKTGGMPLMEALNQRSTARSFQTKELTQQQLSDLLWAAFGINRADGKRTAPSARNFQETDLYVLLKSGVYTYDAKANQLVFVSNEDVRALSGTQDFIKDAPVHIVLVADLSRISGNKNEEKLNTANIDAGYISQNIYLWCASEGLGTGARGLVNRTELAPKLKLKDNQQIIVAHCVGYKK
jgi:SagB-type dehydrogenase family enzyme